MTVLVNRGFVYDVLSYNLMIQATNQNRQFPKPSGGANATGQPLLPPGRQVIFRGAVRHTRCLNFILKEDTCSTLHDDDGTADRNKAVRVVFRLFRFELNTDAKYGTHT